MDSLKLIKKLAPEVTDLVGERYRILRYIYYNEPIGRRTVANKLNIQERTVRNEANILKEQGLLNIDSKGMNITEKGLKLIDDLQDVYLSLIGIPDLEDKLRSILGIRSVSIVPSNENDPDTSLNDIGKLTSEILKRKLKDEDIIGITGGTTVARVAEECVEDNRRKDIMVVPARGGLGKDVYTQSNSIAAILAEKLSGDYRLLYVPDGLSKEALDIMLDNREIQEVLKLIDSMDHLIFGIGRGDVMAKRRNLSKDQIDDLLSKGVVSEAFGHYFDINGEEVWEYPTIGISIEQFINVENAIGVAAGKEKAEAIIAISTLNKNMQLVTDELAAREIIRIKSS